MLHSGGILVLVCLTMGPSLADYVWDGEEWKWQDVPAVPVPGDDTEGSGGAVSGRYEVDDEDEAEGSGEDPPHYSSKEEEPRRHRIEEEIDLDADDEIDPNEVDIGFHDEPSAAPAPSPSPTPITSSPTPPSEEPKKHPQSETNFFAQPGILAAVVGGTVVGLLCTILLVMLIVYRMRKADEGSYSLNEPKRSPNVHSYLKAPTREFFA